MRTFTLILAMMLSGMLLQAQTGSPCPGEPTVTYDGKTYNTILVGDKCWLKENLNVGTMILSNQDQTNNSVIEKYCYGNTEANCNTYGGLYSWNEMMQYSVTPGIQGICPAGWRIPSDEEWCTMATLLDATINCNFIGLTGTDAGGQLKEIGTAHWNAPNTGATNLSGFSGLPGGYFTITYSTFSNEGCTGIFHTSSSNGPGRWAWQLNYDEAKVSRVSYKPGAFSVRCIRDYIIYNLNLEVNPADAGTVTGAGQYQAGEEINTTAAANTGWEFVNWTDNNGIVSETPDFTYTMPAADITLTANFEEEQAGFACGDQISDIDGNIYNTVLIGSQCWIKENLKTTKYQSGTPIEYPGDNNGAWQNNTTGAYAWYDNDISWKDSYGAVYNWHAVNNADGLCPAGWHVPSDTELTQLVDYVVAQGYPNVWNIPNGAGNALKSCRQVNSPNGWDCNTTEHPRWDSDITHNGFDAFGFSGLPGGLRSNTGLFSLMGSSFRWWSSTQHNSTLAHFRSLVLTSNLVSRVQNSKSTGMSVRCIKTPSTP